MNMKRAVCTLVTITTMALAGCGGGGGGSSPMSNNNMNDMPTTPTTPTPPGNTGGGNSMPTTFANLTSTTAANAQRAAAQVADASPRFGSITQSSNTINNITQDQVTVTTEYGATQNAYSIQNGSTWSISTADGNPRRIDTTADDTGGFRGSELNKQVNGGTLWVDVYSDIKAPETSAGSGTYDFSFPGINVGGRFVQQNSNTSLPAVLNGVAGRAQCTSCSFVYTTGQLEMTMGSMTFTPSDGSSPTTLTTGGNTQTTPDADYLSGGIWLFVPTNAASADDYVVGAFGDGSDPFTQSALPALIGTARYIGEATGIYSATENDATEIGYFDANATLDADFGDGNGLGTINGYLNGIEVDGVSRGGRLTLGTADIGASNSGFFEGRLSGSSQGTSYTGRWGGAFFGNGETDNKPGSVGGTFGGRSADSSQSFVGVFGAYKQ